MQFLAEIVVVFLLLAGGFFGLVGSIGLVKLPDPMARLHGPTKAATLGVGAVLIASMIYFPAFLGVWSWHEFLISLFITLTAPITGHFIAKANMFLLLRPGDLPAPGPGPGSGAGLRWATYGDGDAGDDAPEDERQL